MPKRVDRTRQLLAEWSYALGGEEEDEAAGQMAAAAIAGDVVTYTTLRRRLDPYHVVGARGETMLMAAGVGNFYPILRDVIDSWDSAAGFDAPDDTYGRTALHWSAVRHRRAEATMLVQAGARIDAPDLLGRTPLLVALISSCDSDAESRHENEKLARMLVAAGADLNADESSALARRGSVFSYALAKGYTGLALEMVEKGVDLGLQFGPGRTRPDEMLERAISRRRVKKSGPQGEQVKRLLELLAPFKGAVTPGGFMPVRDDGWDERGVYE